MDVDEQPEEAQPEAAKGTTGAAPKRPREPDDDADALPLPSDDLDIRVKKGYTREYTKSKLGGAQAVTGMQKCPITGQMIPAEEMSQHLKILLLDPKWKQQKDQLLERARKESAFDDNVEANLAGFVSKRPDIFGDVEEQIRQAAEMNAEASAREAGADAGPAHSHVAAIQNAQQQAEQQKASLKDLPIPPIPPPPVMLPLPGTGGIGGIGLGMGMMGAPLPVPIPVPPAGGVPPAMPTPVPVPPSVPASAALDDEDDAAPDAKRRKLDEASFEAEDAFLAKHTGDVKIIVQVLGVEARGAETVTVECP